MREQGEERLNSRRLSIATGAAALLFAGLLAAVPGRADVFTLTSCHIIGAACEGGSVPSGFGTVTLTQSGTSVNFDVVLSNGNRFAESGASGGGLFVFNDMLAGSTITSPIATLNGTTTSLPLTGFTNLAPVMADGTGTFTAEVECTFASDCNGGSTPTINDLHFTVTNATLAQLEIANANGNLFVAGILCGATQTGCTGGLIGDADVSAPATVPEPSSVSFLLLGAILVGLKSLRRRFGVIER
jgi:hypothetical protein